ncbi:MAG: hypothetical protein ACI9HK_003793 [Pirellulaceae bacterium]|jgi:hypothetical protein
MTLFDFSAQEVWSGTISKDAIPLTSNCQLSPTDRLTLASLRRHICARVALWLLGVCTIALGMAKQLDAEIKAPMSDPRHRVVIEGDHAQRWREGSYEVWVLKGHCSIRQGNVIAKAGDAVVWIDRSIPYGGELSKVTAYLEDNVVVDYGHYGGPHTATRRAAQTIRDKTWIGRFQTADDVDIHVPQVQGMPKTKPEIVKRGMSANSPETYPVKRTQFIQPLPPVEQRVSARSIIIQSRSNVPIQFDGLDDVQRKESVFSFTSGVNIVVSGIEGLDGYDQLSGDKIDVEADNLVVWTQRFDPTGLDKLGNGQIAQDSNTPLEFYMEGNIIFREGDRVIYAERMYYNVRDRHGVILDAEILTPVEEYQGLLRIKADVLQQVDRQNFIAHRAAATSSRLGVPRYWFQSETLAFQDSQVPALNPFTGEVVIDPETGDPAVDHELLATSRNNFLYVGGYPVFYWPVLATDLTKPTYYVDQIRFKSDNVFGFQALIDWDMYQLTGWRRPPKGTKWTLSTDYLDERGPALGTYFEYDREGLFGVPGPYTGTLDVWGIHDTGADNLGLARRAVVPEREDRGRIFWQHRHRMPYDLQLTAELGLISDNNFLEQYHENEWDQLKDQSTGIELKQLLGHSSWSVTGDVRINDFFTQADTLRFDHFLIGQPLLSERVNWHAHTNVGYANLNTANLPPMGVEPPQAPLAWETTTGGTPFNDRGGIVGATRHEVDMPFDVGPVRFVPYALGEIAHWDEDRDGNDVTRTYGQAGIRANLPMWTSMPQVQNGLFNVNGLAHKVNFETEFMFAESNRDMNQLTLYNPLDDDATEHFRRRFTFDTFGGTIPAKFDDRLYALRSGTQSWVTTNNTEIADDLMVLRLGVNQRLQTKRGLPGQERVVDWMTLDIEGALFPKGDRDNFGEDLGLLRFDYRWHIGDRFTVLSDGHIDVFGDGLRMFTIGGKLSRPEQGNVYVGFRSIEGPISSNVVLLSFSYRANEKWIFSAGASVDFGPTGNIGQTASVTRIGESTFMRLGVNFDESRDSVGMIFQIEPRFLAKKLGRVGGVVIPPAGYYGLQ